MSSLFLMRNSIRGHVSLFFSKNNCLPFLDKNAYGKDKFSNIGYKYSNIKDE